MLGRVSLLVVGVFPVCGLLTAGAAPLGLGPPPRPCGDYEYLKNFTCLFQSRAMTFTITPKQVAPGGIVTAQTKVIFASPTNLGGGDAVAWSWDSLAGILGARQPGCGPERGSSPLVSKCTFKAGAVTNGWRTVILPFSTFQGPAFSRDYFAIVAKPRQSPPKPKPTQTAKSRERVKSAQLEKDAKKCLVTWHASPDTLNPQVPEVDFAGAPKNAYGRVWALTGNKVAWRQAGTGPRTRLQEGDWILFNEQIITSPGTRLAAAAITGPHVALNSDTSARFQREGTVQITSPRKPGKPVLKKYEELQGHPATVCVSAIKG